MGKRGTKKAGTNDQVVIGLFHKEDLDLSVFDLF